MKLSIAGIDSKEKIIELYYVRERHVLASFISGVKQIDYIGASNTNVFRCVFYAKLILKKHTKRNFDSLDLIKIGTKNMNTRFKLERNKLFQNLSRSFYKPNITGSNLSALSLQRIRPKCFQVTQIIRYLPKEVF